MSKSDIYRKMGDSTSKYGFMDISWISPKWLSNHENMGFHHTLAMKNQPFYGNSVECIVDTMVYTYMHTYVMRCTNHGGNVMGKFSDNLQEMFHQQKKLYDVWYDIWLCLKLLGIPPQICHSTGKMMRNLPSNLVGTCPKWQCWGIEMDIPITAHSH